MRFGGILLDSGRLSSHKTFRQCFLTRAADTPEAFSKTSSKTLRGPAAEGQTVNLSESSLRAEDELCAELCAERPSGGLSAPSRGTPTAPLPKSRDERLFALWHRLFASGAKGRWFESTRAYHILKDLQARRWSTTPHKTPTNRHWIGPRVSGCLSSCRQMSESSFSTAVRTVSGISFMYQPVISSFEWRSWVCASFGDP